MNNKKWIAVVFAILVGLTLLTPFLVFKDLLFPYVTSKAYYLRILVEMALPFYLYLVLAYKEYRPNFKNPITISLLAFLLFNIVAGIFGVNPLRSFWGNYERMGGIIYLAHLTLLYFYVLLLGQLGMQYIRRFFVAVIWCGAAMAIYSVMVQLTGNHFFMADPSYPRVSATLGNPIFLASFLILPMFLTVYYMVGEEARWKQVMYGIIAAMELYCVLLSETRGAVIGIIGGLFLAAVAYVVLTKNRQLRLWGGVIIAVFVIVAAGGYAFHNDLPAGGMLHRVFNLKDSNTEARIIQWGVALRGYAQYPILGVGPEDYYVIANKYYNPAIYQYDPSWFDKPHNYLIEVLVTSGIFGFISYISLLGFTLWALWLAYKKGFLNLLELCLLGAGFLSYTFQNFTVFDTVSASLTFFVFVGLAGYLWRESRSEDAEGKKKLTRGLQPAFVNTVVALSVIVVIYGLWALNFTGMEAGKAVNYGYAYSGVNPQVSETYFQRAISLPFYFDPIQVSSKYGEFATNLAQNPGTQTSDFVNQILQNAIAAQKDAIARVSNDPTAWQELSTLYLSTAIYNKVPPDPEALTAAQQAVALAPERPEPTLTEARIALYENNSTTAESLLEGVVNNIPLDYDAKLQLAIVYAYNNQTAKGLQIAQPVLDTGYVPAQTNEISWMGQAYQDENNFAAAAKIYQILVTANSSDLQDQWNLAQMDVKLGDTQSAIAIAQQLMAEDSKDAAQFQAFINSLK